MTLHYVPDQGFVYAPPDPPADNSPRGLVNYARGLFTTAMWEAETYLLDHGYPPYDLAGMDVLSRCSIGWWREDVGGTGPDYPGTELVVYVSVPLPYTDPPDVPPPPPPADVTPPEPTL